MNGLTCFTEPTFCGVVSTCTDHKSSQPVEGLFHWSTPFPKSSESFLTRGTERLRNGAMFLCLVSGSVYPRRPLPLTPPQGRGTILDAATKREGEKTSSCARCQYISGAVWRASTRQTAPLGFPNKMSLYDRDEYKTPWPKQLR